MGSIGIAGWIAQLTFWAVLGIGVWSNELDRRAAAIFVALWIAGFAGLPWLPMVGSMLVTPFVAILDIVLVFVVFKGDVTLS